MITTIMGDCATEMIWFDDGFFDLCVTSPPYDKLRTYDGNSDWDFTAVAKEIFRVLKPGGVLCWNVADSVINGSRSLTSLKQAIHFTDVVGFRLDDVLIWEKVHVAAPCKTRYHQMSECVYVFTKGEKATFNPIKDRPNKWFGKSPFSYNSKRQPDGEIKRTSARKPIEEFGKRSNVWRGNSRAQEAPCQKLSHPAMMAKWLARDLIISWSNAGEKVLDPFAGSGTTGQEAEKLGRDSWMIEKNSNYVPRQTPQ